ncbi:MAG: DNA-3-methyladenine glycosylase [Bacteroidetes bacterium]|nr:DNA-3-methyladenine glycosylase [Bacteroidota bacterium]
MRLEKAFYLGDDVVQIARDLLGKYLYTNFDGSITAGIITETEAYAGITDKASHAYGDRRTLRTEIMYREGGIAYVYLCYGMYSLFNVVTNINGIPHAVLIRGIHPVEGLEKMKERYSQRKQNNYSVDGPGKLSKALGIHYSHSGIDLQGNQIWIEEKGVTVNQENIFVSKRIGVEYAKEDALLPYRFVLGNYEL